jgi:glycosyltransferase involved in cell wall biosynthesis
MPEVLYVCYEFPRLSETFISNEFLELRRRGVAVRALALYPSHPEQLSLAARQLTKETLCVPRPGLWRGLGDLLWMLRRRPRRTLRALTLLRRGEAPARRWVAYASHLLYACHVARRVDLHDVAVYHAHFAAGPASVAMFLGLLTGRPYTVVAHAYDLYRDRMALGVKLQTAAGFVTISRENRDWLMERCGTVADRVRVIHCGVDAKGLEVRAAMATRAEPPLVVSVGRLAAKKGHDTLIEACALVKGQGIDFTCQIVGDGDERSRLQALIHRLGLDGQVDLAGAMSHDETLALVATGTVAALACRTLANGDRDGIPVSLMEAMALSLPVVSTRVSGIPELVQDGSNGLLVNPDDPAALASALSTLLTDKARRATFGTAARLSIEREFDLARTTERMCTLLESVAKQPLTGA